MQTVTVSRLVIVNACLTLSLFRRPGSLDRKEQARQAAQQALHRALHGADGAPAEIEPESPLNLLRVILDYCDTEGVPHSEVVAAFNSHARATAPHRASSTVSQELRL